MRLLISWKRICRNACLSVMSASCFYICIRSVKECACGCHDPATGQQDAQPSKPVHRSSLNHRDRLIICISKADVGEVDRHPYQANRSTQPPQIKSGIGKEERNCRQDGNNQIRIAHYDRDEMLPCLTTIVSPLLGFSHNRLLFMKHAA